jgi:hypothetical protein
LTKELNIMKKKNKALLLLTLLVLAGFIAVGNWYERINESIDSKEEFRKLYQGFNTGGNQLHITGTIRLLDKEQNDKLTEETSFEYVSSSLAYYSRLDYVQTFSDGQLAVQLDTVNKYVMVSPVEAQQMQAAGNAMFPFEQFLSDTSQFKVHLTAGEREGWRWLRINSELNPEIKTCMIIYDPLSYEVKEVEVEWWKEPVLEEEIDEKKCWLSKIEYRYHATSSLNIRERIGRILKVNKDKIELTERYKEYNYYGL